MALSRPSTDGAVRPTPPTGTGGPPTGAAGGDLTGTYPNPSVVASSAVTAGKIELATQAEVDAGVDAVRAVTPATLASAATVMNTGEAAGGDLTGTYPNPSVVATSTTTAGKIELATQAEVDAGTDADRAVTPATLAAAATVVNTGDAAGGDLTGTYPNPSVVAASDTVAGKIELATQAEVDAGTDTVRAVTPATRYGADNRLTAITTSTTLTSADSGRAFSNEGATALVIFTLPTPSAGLHFKFVVADADGIRLEASTGTTIRIFGNETNAAPGITQCNFIGGTIEIVAVNATQWVAIAGQGPWIMTGSPTQRPLLSTARILFDSNFAGLTFPVTTISTGTFSGFLHRLNLYVHARGDDAAAAVDLICTMNGDTTDANYISRIIQGSGAVPAVTYTGDVASRKLADIVAAGGTASRFTSGVWSMPFFSGSTRSRFHGMYADDRSATDGVEGHGSLERLTSAVLTSLDFTLSAGDFVSGTRIMVTESL